jgi:sialate O-acetylesterase
MYNAMIHPLIHYTIKCFIWYQGESNVGKHDVYAQRLANMVNLWRKDWGLGDLPFYYVEIAPWIYGDGETGTSGALLREAQFKAQSLIPNSGMISTNDLVEEYEKNNIHPRNKIDVGKRLAYMALSQTYGLKGIASHGPEYKSMEIKDGKIYLSFNYAEDGFSRVVDIKGFEIAGEDHIFYPAKVEVDLNNRMLIVSNENISKPVAARYCFKNFQIGNLYNTRELPVVPFRTDNFEK